MTIVQAHALAVLGCTFGAGYLLAGFWSVFQDLRDMLAGNPSRFDIKPTDRED